VIAWLPAKNEKGILFYMKRGSLSSLIPAGTYAEATSPLHRLRPESKLCWAAGLIALTAWAPGAMMLIPAVLVGLGLLLAGISPLHALRRLRAFFWFLLAVALFPALFTPGPGVAGPFGAALPVSAEGLAAGSLSAARMALMFLTSWLLLSTTPPARLVTLADRAAARSPWCKEGLGEFFRVGLIAFQMLPPLCLEADRLLFEEAAARSGAQERLWHKARRASGLLAPLVLSIFKEPERFAAGAAGEGSGDENRAPAGEG